MDLSQATIEEMAEELRRRRVEFALIVSPIDDDGLRSEDEDYLVYSSAEHGENSIGEAVRCLIGGLTVLTSVVSSTKRTTTKLPRFGDGWQLAKRFLTTSFARPRNGSKRKTGTALREVE